MDKLKSVAAFIGIFAVLSFAAIAIDVNLDKPIVKSSSCSNHPIVSQGDLLIVENTELGELELGDTLIYRAQPSSSNKEIRSSEMFVAHQVVNVSEDTIETKGNSNEA